MRIIFEGFVMNNCTKILLTDIVCYGWAKFSALDICYVYIIGIRVSTDQKLLTLMFETEVMWVLAAISVTMRYDITSLCDWCPKFRHRIVASSLRVEKSNEETSIAQVQKPKHGMFLAELCCS